LQNSVNERRPVIAPIVTKEFFGSPEEVAQEDKYVNSVDNDLAYVSIIKRNAYTLIEFTQSMPNNIVYRL